MSDALVPLSVAFVWHMHQPEYKDNLTGEYLMPWVRLHAVKDYLDMVLILEEYPRIRQTFNLVPSLIDQLEDYTRPETRDRHMSVMLKDLLTDEDRLFICQRFFDAAHHTMIARSPYYMELLHRRQQIQWEEPDLTLFSDQEYFDITALFHLVWTDPLWFERMPELQALWKQGAHYTLAQRQQILEIHRQIICQVLPTYRAFQEKGQIEVTTTPYYHPILPLLFNSDSARVAMPEAVLPEESFQYPEDATYHVRAARERYEALFGRPACGVWPAEQSISPDAALLLKQEGFGWAVSSEGNLARSLDIRFDKDPYGNIINVETLCQPYQYAGLTFLFRNLTLSDLIGFHYASMPPEQAADDLVHRLKLIQKRCTQMGVARPIVTIALDGENCWEGFQNDGHAFLNALYAKLSADATLDVCRVQDYLASITPEAIQPLSKLHSGSWINSDFHIWIGDPVKNAAWMHLKRTRADLVHLTETGHYQPEILAQAWKEIYIAEGSDWFWWYGEPHNSGQDDVFDMQFRRHLANVYRLLDMEIPNFLDIPLTVTMGRPVATAQGPIQPCLDGLQQSQADWDLAGCFDLVHGAMHRGTRILKKVYFGSDHQRLYLRFIVNTEAVSPYHEVYLYFCTPGKTRHNSPIRMKSLSGHTAATQRFHYAYEIQLGPLLPNQLSVTAAEAMADHLWFQRSDLQCEAVMGDVLDVAIPLDKLNTHAEDYIQFSVALVQGGVIEEFQPETFVLSLKRYCEAEVTQELDEPTACASALSDQPFLGSGHAG